MLQRQQSPLWPAFPAAAGERYRLAHARIQGRPLTSRHLLRFGCSRGAGPTSTRPIEIASTDCHAEWQRFSRSRTPSIDKEPGRLFTLAALHFEGVTRTITTLFRPLRIYRAGLDPAHRSQPRPRTASWAKRRLPTSATISQNTGTPGERPFLARSSPFRRSSLPRRGFRGCERHGTEQLF